MGAVGTRHRHDLPPHAIADALAALHDALAYYPRELPPFTSHLDHVGAVLADAASSPSLAASDRLFLQKAHGMLIQEVAAFGFDSRPLHGGPHLDGNVLSTNAGPRFIDFEAARIGPREWDLAYLPSEVAASFPYVDEDLLEALGAVTSLCVATWCWMQPQRAPEVAEAAAFHLNVLRRRFGRSLA